MCVCVCVNVHACVCSQYICIVLDIYTELHCYLMYQNICDNMLIVKFRFISSYISSIFPFFPGCDDSLL